MLFVVRATLYRLLSVFLISACMLFEADVHLFLVIAGLCVSGLKILPKNTPQSGE